MQHRGRKAENAVPCFGEQRIVARLIGHVLVELGVLTNWQVDRILEHQKLSRQRFGQIAVSWGWAQPQDVWRAWALHLVDQTRVMDLDEVGIDAGAVEKVPPAIAWHYRAVPIRMWGENLVLAVAEHLAQIACHELPTLLGGNLHFCLADRKQIDHTLDRVYPLTAL
jgi:type IV pilus assembly protein PilB